MGSLSADRTLTFLRTRLSYELHRAAAEVHADVQLERDTKAAQGRAQRGLPESIDHTPPLWQRAAGALEDAQLSRRAHAKFLRWRAARSAERVADRYLPGSMTSAPSFQRTKPSPSTSKLLLLASKSF